MISAGLLTKSATISRGTPATDANRQRVSAFAPIATGVPCEVQPRTESQKRYSEGRLVNGESLGFFNAGVDIRKGDRVTVGSVTWDVVQADDAAGRGDHFECGLQPYRPGGG